MSGKGFSFRGQQALDAIAYAVAVTAIVVVGSIAISFTLGGDWIGVKYVLFIVGIGMFGISTFKLRPTAAWRDSSGDGNTGSEHLQTSEGESRVQAAVQRVPPLNRYELHPNERLSGGAKLFLASIFVLAVSFLMESVFGVVP